MSYFLTLFSLYLSLSLSIPLRFGYSSLIKRKEKGKESYLSPFRSYFRHEQSQDESDDDGEAEEKSDQLRLVQNEKERRRSRERGRDSVKRKQLPLRRLSLFRVDSGNGEGVKPFRIARRRPLANEERIF